MIAHELSDCDVFAAAALALCKKMGWKGDLIGGATKKGYVFCFENSNKYKN